MMLSRLARSALVLAAIAPSWGAPASAAEAVPRPGATSVCDGGDDAPTDAFGFTDSSGIVDLGGGSLGLTLGGNAGVREGRSLNRGATLLGSYGILPCLEIGASLFGGTTRSVIARERLKDRSHGAGLEMRYRLLNHSHHGFGLTFGMDVGVERNDDRQTGRFDSYNTGFKVLADRVLIPETLYAALNLSHNMIWNGTEPFSRSSTFAVGAALAWQFADGIYLSGEVRHLRQQNSLGFGNHAGHATFVGPGLYWQATERLALSIAYNVQVTGHERGRRGPLDLTNFSRHLVQVDIGWSF
ncbi:transporter [Bosea sp. (in: a-proteobacteria)]|uniref:transporter n=1 Tax=Bosea sp. (in: a-proteobacteria) TaxID=1871050 RepID=UPI003F718734